MVDVVGLRFITEGEKEAIAALNLYRAGIRQLRDLQDRHVAAMNRALRAEQEAQQRATQERQRALQSYQRLMGAMNPALAASQQYAASQDVIRTAHAQGVISAQKMAAALAQLAQQYRTDQLARYSSEQQKLSITLIYGDATVKRLDTDMQALTERYRQGSMTAQQHQAALTALARQLAINNGYVTASGALNTQKALSELRAAQATRDAAAATAAANAAAAAHAQRINDLRMKYQSGYAEFVRARQAIRELNQAKREGIITAQQYADRVAALRSSYGDLTGSLNQASLGLNRTAVLTQQAGYQVGDFFVQVQSGTNVMVAFGQQATQLVGTLAMLSTSTRNIMMLSGLGVLIAIGTAIGAAMMRASGQTESLEQKMQKLQSTGDSLLATFNLLAEDNLALRFGNLADEVDGLANSMLALDRAAQLRTLLETLDKLEDESRAGFLRQMGEGALNIGRVIIPFGEFYKTTGEVNEEFFGRLGFDMARSQYLAYIEELNALATQGDVEAVVAVFNRMMADAVDGSDNISQTVSAQGYALADSIRTSVIALAELAAELNGSAAAAKTLQEDQERAVQGVVIRAELAIAAAEEAAAAQMKIDEDVNARAVQAVGLRAELAIQRAEEAAEAEAALLEEAQRRGVDAVILRTERALDVVKQAADAEAAALEEAQRRGTDAIILRAQAALDAADKVAAAEAENRRQQEIRNASAMARIADYEREVELNIAIARYGAESAEVEAIKRAQAMAAVEAYIRQEQLTGEIANQVRAAAAAAYDTRAAVSGITSELSMATTQAQNLAAALDAAAAAGAARQQRIAVLTAQIAAAQAGANVSVAGTRAEEEFRLSQAGLPDFLVSAGGAIAAAEAQTVEALAAELSALTQVAGGTAGTAGGAAQELATLQSITGEMLTRIERERELIGLTGQARRERELTLQIEDQLRQQGITATEEAIQNAAAKIAAEEAVNAKMLEQQQIVENLTQTIKTQMADAFMSIVDGTKSAEDAFKDMARIIIAELYDVLVVQQLVAAMSSAISGFSGAVVGVSSKPIGQTASLSAGAIRSAMGNVFTTNINRAPSVIPFAVGGVVSTPTMFPMAGGNVGLMGEAGPEAIMPLKRGRDGKLGVQAEGGGTVVVNNHFNVSANGDESVKRIVAQQIPTIARATEAAVIDARQRGGKMRSAFR